MVVPPLHEQVVMKAFAIVGARRGDDVAYHLQREREGHWQRIDRIRDRTETTVLVDDVLPVFKVMFVTSLVV